MGSCFSSPEAQPSKPSTSTSSPSAGPSANNRTTGSAVQMSNAAGATPATQTTITNKPGQTANEQTRPAVPAGPLDGDGTPETANPMSDNDFTSALNAAPEPASSGNTMGQSAVAGSVAGKDGQPARAQRDRSYAIDKLIEEDSKKFKKECKILLLGELRFPPQDICIRPGLTESRL